MNKHTPGPWRHLTRDKSHRISADTCAICEIPDDSFSTRNLDERNANAVLIASAPTMLAALEGCVAYLEHLRTFCPDQGRDARFEAACAAIALATGKEK